MGYVPIPRIGKYSDVGDTRVHEDFRKWVTPVVEILWIAKSLAGNVRYAGMLDGGGGGGFYVMGKYS